LGGWLTGPALKAANEHTYATQRAKKASDRAKSKLPPRKLPTNNNTNGGGRSSSSFSASAGFAPSLSYSTTATMTAIWAEVWDARKMMTTDDLDWPELPLPTPPPPPLPSLSIECAALRPTQDREVPLSALVRPIKPRGAKAKAKGAFPPLTYHERISRLTLDTPEGEFEFLPPVKNVIVLDDTESNVPDEPWEYISSVGGDDEARKIFSYAEIVSKSA
jgi:hypothetical protein